MALSSKSTFLTIGTLLAALGCTSIRSHAAIPQVSCSNISVTVGQTFTFPISISNVRSNGEIRIYAAIPNSGCPTCGTLGVVHDSARSDCRRVHECCAGVASHPHGGDIVTAGIVEMQGGVPTVVLQPYTLFFNGDQLLDELRDQEDLVRYPPKGTRLVFERASGKPLVDFNGNLHVGLLFPMNNAFSASVDFPGHIYTTNFYISYFSVDVSPAHNCCNGGGPHGLTVWAGPYTLTVRDPSLDP